MFEWTKCSNDLEFRGILSSNPWLKKFLMSYCFDEGFLFFNARKVLSGMNIEEMGQGQYFKQQLIKHINQKRKEIAGTPMHLQSFQYLIYIINSMRKNVRGHYDIIVPYLVQLDNDDVPFVIDIFLKEFKLNKTQLRVLKGG
jgi:hypothetical protein